MCIAQKTEVQVPENVKSGFAQKYPAAKEVEWKFKDSLYRVSFEENDLDVTIHFDSLGNAKKIKQEINPEELPQAVKDAISKKFKNKKITEAVKKTNKKGITKYEVEIGNKDYTYDEKGILQK